MLITTKMVFVARKKRLVYIFGFLVLFYLVLTFTIQNAFWLLSRHDPEAEAAPGFTKSKFIFVGGMQRSGTTLMRAILDVAHKAIYCGPETHLLPTVLEYLYNLKHAEIERIEMLQNSGFKAGSFDHAVAGFVHSFLSDRNASAPRICTKDPYILAYMEYLHELFPNAQFVYMVRDGRAVASSMVNCQSNPAEYFRYHLRMWNNYNKLVSELCKRVGERHCLLVKYERLVLHPRETIQQVMSFLNETFLEEQLSHQDHFASRIQVNHKLEWSSGQIMNAIHPESLTKWMYSGVEISAEEMSTVAPYLGKLNYSINLKELDYLHELSEDVLKRSSLLINKDKLSCNTNTLG